MDLIHYVRSSLIRNKGRNLLIGVILLAMITLCGVSLILNAGSAQIVEAYQSQYGSRVTLHSSLNAEKIKPDVLLSFSDSSVIHSYSYTAKAAMNSSLIKALGESDETSEIPKFYLKAVSVEEEAFQQNIKILVKGEKPAYGEEVMISKELAELNHLDLGSKLVLNSKTGEVEVTLTVVGIYEDLGMKNRPETIPLMNPSNEIYINYTSFLQSDIFAAQGELEAVFYLKQPSDLNTFQSEIQAKGLPEGYEARTDAKGYAEATAPASSIHRLSKLFMTGILAVGSLLLLLITAFSIRERKYEIGLLRAMGMSKKRVLETLIWETLILCGSCLVLGLIIANLLGPVLGHGLLLGQKEMIQGLANIAFTLDIRTVLLLGLIMLACGIITSVFGILTLVRFEPAKILAERN